jgi:anaphase-promoting complex subunit 4
MMPALDRCSVILSRFSGIAKFQGANDTVGFSSKDIALMMDTVACLHLVSTKILIQVVDEIDLFGAFTSWMRYEIDRLAADSSVPKEEELEKEASLDHSKVLMFLQTCMPTSPIETYLGDSMLDESKLAWGQSQKGLSMFELLDKQLQKQEQGFPYIKSLPRIELLCRHLTEQAKEVFSQIAKAEKRNVVFGKPQEIGSAEKDGLVDMYMAADVRARAILNMLLLIHISFNQRLELTWHLSRKG